MPLRPYKRLDWTTAVAGSAVGLMFNQPFSVGTMNPHQARQLGESLIEAADAVERAEPRFRVRWLLNDNPHSEQFTPPMTREEAIETVWHISHELGWHAEIVDACSTAFQKAP
jgi:hypothetical protein